MKAISSADLNWGIGYKGQLLQRVPEDMKYFMKMTMGKVVVMGRETFESLPGRQPLKNRVNIVLTKNAGYDVACYPSDNTGISASSSNKDSNTGSDASKQGSLIICPSVEELFKILKDYPTDDIFVIGGQSIYTQLLPYCSEVYITRFEKVFEADRHFPNLDRMDNWKLEEESEPHDHNGMGFRFLKYVNRSVLLPF
jgi:dihydrofolate reductase